MHSSLRFKLIIPFSLLLIVGSFTLIGRLATHAAGTSFKLSTKSGVASTALLSQCGAWSVVPSPNVGTNDSTLTSVAAVSANNVWAVGYSINNTTSNSTFRTLFEHWNGTVWSIVSSSNLGVTSVLNGVVRVPGSNQLWTVGQAYTGNTDLGTLTMQHNGTTWKAISSPNPTGGVNSASPLNGVAAVSANNAWAVGYSHGNSSSASTLIEHWNGTTWSIIASPNPAIQNYLNGVTRVPRSSQLWSVGYSYNSSVAQTLIEFYC